MDKEAKQDDLPVKVDIVKAEHKGICATLTTEGMSCVPEGSTRFYFRTEIQSSVEDAMGLMGYGCRDYVLSPYKYTEKEEQKVEYDQVSLFLKSLRPHYLSYGLKKYIGTLSRKGNTIAFYDHNDVYIRDWDFEPFLDLYHTVIYDGESIKVTIWIGSQ